MPNSRERLTALIEIYGKRVEDPNTRQTMETVQTFALLIIARELYDIEGSLDTISQYGMPER